MSRCPYCAFEAATVSEEVAHMQAEHPDIVAERLGAAGLDPQVDQALAVRRAEEALRDHRAQRCTCRKSPGAGRSPGCPEHSEAAARRRNAATAIAVDFERRPPIAAALVGRWSSIGWTELLDDALERGVRMGLVTIQRGAS